MKLVPHSLPIIFTVSETVLPPIQEMLLFQLVKVSNPVNPERILFFDHKAGKLLEKGDVHSLVFDRLATNSGATGCKVLRAVNPSKED